MVSNFDSGFPPTLLVGYLPEPILDIVALKL
jgi:hypothetical protein